VGLRENFTAHKEQAMICVQQSAIAQSPAARGLSLYAELIVRTPFLGFSTYEGTRFALEAEGILPEGMPWPEGFREHSWSQGSLRMEIRRKRPDGIKGPRRDFLDVDWWECRIEPASAPDYSARYIAEKALELQAAIHAQSPAGKAERRRQWDLFVTSMSDDDFQAFKAKIPGLIKPSRGTRQASVRGASA